MTSPYYPPPGQQPQYPPQQQPAYPPQQPAYPPQQPQYAPPAPAYYPPPAPAYPQPPANLDIDDFYDQPAASGKSISGWFQTPGQSISGVVARAISKADIRPQTDMQTKQPLPPRADGSVRSTMSIPLLVQPSPDFPDGRASWIVGPSDREDLDFAMQAAGCKPKTVPEAGAVITVTFTGLKQIPGFGAPKKVKTVTYQRPANANGHASPAPQPEPAPVPQYDSQQPYANQAPGYQYAPPQPSSVPAPQYAPPAPQPQYQAPQYAPQQPPFQAPYADPNAQAAQPNGGPVPPPQQPAAPAPQYAAPDNLTPEQAERLRQLTGGQ